MTSFSRRISVFWSDFFNQLTVAGRLKKKLLSFFSFHWKLFCWGSMAHFDQIHTVLTLFICPTLCKVPKRSVDSGNGRSYLTPWLTESILSWFVSFNSFSLIPDLLSEHCSLWLISHSEPHKRKLVSTSDLSERLQWLQPNVFFISHHLYPHSTL